MTAQPRRRTRRAEPINKHVAKNGAVTYWFQADLGDRDDGTRMRKRFTYNTFNEARREYRRILTEVGQGRYIVPTDLTVAQCCTVNRHG